MRRSSSSMTVAFIATVMALLSLYETGRAILHALSGETYRAAAIFLMAALYIKVARLLAEMLEERANGLGRDDAP